MLSKKNSFPDKTETYPYHMIPNPMEERDPKRTVELEAKLEYTMRHKMGISPKGGTGSLMSEDKRKKAREKRKKRK